MRAVLLVIDMQVDFFASERLMQRQTALVAATNALVRSARDAQVPVIWVRQQHQPDLRDAMLGDRRSGRRIVISGTPGAEPLPGLDVRDGDSVVLKTRYSAFFNTTLDRELQRRGADLLVVAGVNTHACIRTSVIDAYQRDYDIVLARECIDSWDAEHHDVSWRYMDGRLARGMDITRIRDLFATAR